MRTIGSVIHPNANYDLESSLRVHRLLVLRALHKRWRFQGRWVVTGPLETLMGIPGCGSGCGATDYLCLNLIAQNGIGSIVRFLNQRIFEAMCAYLKFASIDETIPSKEFVPCDKALAQLAAYECGRTKHQMNEYHRRATLVKNVRIECRPAGISVNADVSFNTRPMEGSWELFYLARKPAPRWNERSRLARWITRACDSLSVLCSKTEPIKAK